jgi:hypothetical protein
MLAQQLQVSMLILEMLRSREVITADDVAAFASLPQPLSAAIGLVGGTYQRVASQLGVDAKVA